VLPDSLTQMDKIQAGVRWQITWARSPCYLLVGPVSREC